MPHHLNPDPNTIHTYTVRGRTQARGVLKRGKPAAWVGFPPRLFKKIRAEAIQRQISLSAMVVQLCYAAIDGIE